MNSSVMNSSKVLTMKEKVMANMPKEETVATYTCGSCQCVKKGKPWITIDFPGNLYHACSYSCNGKWMIFYLKVITI